MPGDLFPDMDASSGAGEAGAGFQPLAEIRNAAERRQIERALAATGGHISDAARLLGVSRTTLWEKMTRLEISSQRPES